ncbi:MAG: hypothetical protein ACP5Q1_02255 [Anaerolineae bacterium]
MGFTGWVVILIMLWLALAGGLAYGDARHLGVNHAHALRIALSALLRPHVYWFQERLHYLPPVERARLQAQEAQRLGLQRVDHMRCPLCGAEIAQAWALDAVGRLTLRRRPISCPRCDFRLDSCRHCAHFKAEKGLMYGDDWTQGTCTVYKAVQPVETFCPPSVAQELQEWGYTHLPAPTPIVDSYVPLEKCSAFVLDEHRLKANGVHVPGLRQRGLLDKVAVGTALPAANESNVPTHSKMV